MNELYKEIYKIIELSWGTIPYEYEHKIKLIILTSIEKGRQEEQKRIIKILKKNKLAWESSYERDKIIEEIKNG